jgi:hypothetical protein
MSDDPLTKFTSRAKAQSAGPPQPTLPPSLVPPPTNGREPYDAFDNKVRTTSVEIRCHRTGLSYSIDYGQMSTRVFEFLTGENLSFSGGGYGFVIKGRNLKDLLLAINLHTCGFLQDFSAQHFILPEPVDPRAPYIESIEVVVLRPTPTPPKDGVK